MSERTVIGGVSYETVGSSNANLLLKCNGTARIQWGNKLIDLIKNGKIAQSELPELIFVVQDESQITNDGIYIVQAKDSTRILLYKNTQTYDLLGTDLYISASKKQNITVEQQKQALENIGIYFTSLDEALAFGVKNGVVYITDSKALYLIRDGVASEISTNKNVVTVENKQEKDESDINSSNQQVVLTENVPRGVITMFNNDMVIPLGWAVCDGKSVEYEGELIDTPDLKSMFIERSQQTNYIETNTETNTETEGNTENSDTPDYSQYSLVYIIKL